MSNMRRVAAPVENDKVVWIRGENGVQTPKWLSKIQYRTDIEILGDWKKGDKCHDDPDNKPVASKAKKSVTFDPAPKE